MYARVVVLCAFLFIIIPTVLACEYNSNDRRAQCGSFEILKNAGYQPDWWRLNVIDKGNETVDFVKEDSFVTVPNIVDLQIKGLANGFEYGAFSGLKKLHELHLDDNKLHIIPKRVFAGLSIAVIYIYFCEVEELKPKAFDGLPNLKHIHLYGNKISRITSGVFTNTNIQYLIMRKNGIKQVDDNAFGEMENLIHLSLEENLLTSFEPQLTIGFAPSLTHLYINRNKLSTINRGMFSGIPKLKILLLNINQIVRFGDHSFTDLKELSLLDISNNKLEELQTNVFNAGGMKHLQLLFIHDNQLSFLSTGVLVRLPNLQKMSVGGNPWQCPCWTILDSYLFNHNITRLCYDMYTQGERPFCVFSDVHVKDCIFDLENVTDIPQIYANTMKEYPALPKVCNIDGVQKPVLGAR